MRKYDMPFPLQMIVSLHIGLNVLFLLLQEKYQKKQSKGMLSCLLSTRHGFAHRKQSRSLWKPSARTAAGAGAP